VSERDGVKAPAAGPPEGGGGGAGGAGGGGPEETGAADPRVADVLQRLRSGVRQRQAEAATVGGGLAGGLGGGGSAAGLSQGLLAVKSHEYVQEPVPFSHRRRLASLIVASRKAFFQLFLKWFVRPVMAEQNAFNQAAGRMLQELAEAHERTAREVRLLAGRLADLEARADALAAAAAAAAPVATQGAPSAAASETPRPQPGVEDGTRR
jgi:hypothetical protein